MRIRFTGTVGLDPARWPSLKSSGGQFNRGEEADVPEALANQIIANGFAQRVPPVEVPSRDVSAPPVDRMVKRPDSRTKILHKD